MKLSASGLKNIDFKQIAIDHGEKAVVGLIVLFVGYALYQTNWIPYSRTPDELIEQVETAQSELNSSVWTDEAKYAPKVDVAKQIDNLLAPVNSGRYAWNTEFYWSPYRKKEPIREPSWLPVDNLIASYGQALFPLMPDESMLAGPAVTNERQDIKSAADKAKEEAEKDIPEEFRKKTNRQMKSSAGGVGAPPKGASPFGVGRRKAEDAATAQKIREMSARQPRRRGGKRDSERRAELASTDRGRGHRFVAVRGVFPLHRQIKELERAMGLEGRQSKFPIEQLIRFQSFELERQTMVRGAADPWSGPWEPVDLKVAEAVMKEVAGWEDDTVSDAVLSSVFTMPLPYREVGDWGSLASHPSLKDFELDETEIENQVKFNEALMAKLAEEHAKKAEVVEEGGFSSMQFGVREAVRDSGRTKEQLTDEQFLKSLVEASDPELASDEAKRQQIIDRIKSRISAAGNLLLFRYLDFEVQPGNSYRYRVRLVLFNPFLNRKPEEVLTPEIAEGQVRKTQWSEPTEPVAVPGDADYFVNKVDTGRRGTLPYAEIDLFQWSTDTGTIVNAPVKTNVGSYLGGSVRNVLVLRPVQVSFEKETFRFSTDDMLVDVAAKPSFDRSLHPELQFPPNSKGPTGLADQALVMNRLGDLMTLDQIALQEAHETARQRLQFQNSQYDDIKEKQAKDKEAGEGRLGKRGDDDESGGEPGMRLSKPSSSDNPRRREAGKKKNK